MVVFLISSTLHEFYILPPHTSPLHRSYLFPRKKWIEISLKEPSKWEGGVRNHFSILMNNKHQQPSPREVYFYAKSAQGKHFQPYCIIWPKTFFSTPILLFHMQQNTHKRKTEFERRRSVNLKRWGRGGLRPSPLRKISISGISALSDLDQPLGLPQVISILPDRDTKLTM